MPFHREATRVLRGHRHPLVRRARVLHRRMSRLDATLRGMLWALVAGMLLVSLNMTMRMLTLQLSPFQTQFLRYLAGLLVMLPFVWRDGAMRYRPRDFAGQFGRGALLALALSLWFIAIAHISLADTTAIGFTTPIFIMLGAALLFHEPMRARHWVAAGTAFAGVLLVVGPQLSGSGGAYTVLMLATCPLFAASFLFTKALTRYERPEVIVLWQAITVTLFSAPLALLQWHWPGPLQWLAFLLCGLLGTTGHYCLTRSYAVADISATQSVKFLDLVWAALLGWVAFGDVPERSTLIGGSVICAATIWAARQESRGRVR